MAILKTKDIWEMDIEELETKLAELKAELNNNISKSSAAGIIENPGKVRELKRTIARVLTIMNEKEKER